MASVKLVFGSSPVPTPGPVRLVFGDDDAPPAIPDVTLQGGGRITGLRLHIAAKYDINVQRPTVASTHGLWQDATPQQHAARSAWQQATPLPVGTHSHWQDADAVAASLRAAWNDSLQAQRTLRTLFEQAARLPAEPTRSGYQEAQRLRSDTGSRFQEAVRLPGAPLKAKFQETYRDRQARVGSIFQVADKLAVQIASGMGIAVRLPLGFGGRYQEAWPPRPGQWQRPGPPLSEPCYTPALPAHLIFSDPHDTSLPTRLVFVCERHGPGPDPQPEPGVVVPIRRVYVTINSIILTRVSDGMPLPADGFAMSIDTDSWTWQWSASMQPHLRQYLAPVAGEPVQVQAVVNGVPYRLCAESISSDRSFGSARIAVRGRGLGAVLDAPYAPTRNFGNAAALTAQQIMQAVLTVNGVGIGWDVDWGLTDWLVPAGAWSHQGNYMSAITSIASAAGGYVQPHATLQTLRILPRYPVGPWAWASVPPDFELPADVVSIEGIEWTTKPAYDRVHVSGVAQGVLAEATRAGTAGGVVAPMVTDALITHADAARQRALAVLADTGAQARVTLTLPVLAETGLILPGKFVRYSDGPVQRSGIVRATSLAWSRPTLRQTLQLETHGSD